jgi:LysM repeat protein
MNLSTGPTAPSQNCAFQYTVKRGDSYYLISKRLGVSLRDLIAANPNINPARLMVGDVLCIPMAGATPQIVPQVLGETGEVIGETGITEETGETAPVVPPPTFACPLEQRRTVQPGQTISDFQLNAGLNRHTLETANPNVDLDNLVPGQVICVPDINQPCPLPATYTLCEQDTLETVATQFNVSIAALLRANPCLAPSDFLPCVCISLPQST